MNPKNQIIIYLISAIIILILFISTILLQKIYKIPSKITRKIIHIFTGPIFILTWKLYPKGNYGKISSTFPFLASAIFFLLHILKKYKISELIKNILSRSGESIELIEGPFFYGILIGILTSIFYLNHPIGIITILILCFGDGLADIFGSNFNSVILPSFFGRKTFFGCFSFIFFSFFFSCLYCFYFFRKWFFFNCFVLSFLVCGI
jgi:dolichol kinase